MESIMDHIIRDMNEAVVAEALNIPVSFVPKGCKVFYDEETHCYMLQMNIYGKKDRIVFLFFMNESDELLRVQAVEEGKQFPLTLDQEGVLEEVFTSFELNGELPV